MALRFGMWDKSFFNAAKEVMVFAGVMPNCVPPSNNVPLL